MGCFVRLSYLIEFFYLCVKQRSYTTTTNVSTTSITSGISVFPNPAITQLTIDHLLPSTQRIALTDMMGHVVIETTEFDVDHYTFDLASMPRGMYMLTVNDTEVGILTRKIILQ